jgi:hypothetical protein
MRLRFFRVGELFGVREVVLSGRAAAATLLLREDRELRCRDERGR